MKDRLLTNEEIARALDVSHPTVERWRRGDVAPAQAMMHMLIDWIAQAQDTKTARLVAKEIFPKGYSPRHLQTWAEIIKKELGYESTLSLFLRQLSENWQRQVERIKNA